MNRRDLLKSSATLAAAVVGCIPQEKRPVSGTQAIRLSDDCYVDFRVSGYPQEGGTLIVIDEPCERYEEFLAAIKKGPIRGESTNIVWKQHRLADLPDPKVVPGWSYSSVE